MRINSRTDLERFVSSKLERYQADCYNMSHDELEDKVTENIKDFIKSKGFVYGNDLPEISDDEWQEITNV